MTYEELMEFKRNTADAALNKIFEKIQLKEGMGFIDSLEISYLDGRNCGYDKHITACGLEYVDGKVQTCEFEEFDVPLADFLKQIKYPLVFGGVFVVSDEIEPIEISTQIGLAKRCAPLFEELSCMADQTCITSNTAYEKMLFIHGETPDEEPVANLSL